MLSLRSKPMMPIIYCRVGCVQRVGAALDLALLALAVAEFHSSCRSMAVRGWIRRALMHGWKAFGA